MKAMRHRKWFFSESLKIQKRAKELVNGLSGAPTDTNSATAEANSVTAEAKQTRAAIKELYGFLDLLDRKASSLVTLNSFLLALAGIFVFRPLGIFEPFSSAQSAVLDGAQILILISGGLAAAASFTAIAIAVQLFKIGWSYMANADVERQPADFSKELSELCGEAAFRQWLLGWIRRVTLTALGATALAVAVLIFRIVE